MKQTATKSNNGAAANTASNTASTPTPTMAGDSTSNNAQDNKDGEPKSLLEKFFHDQLKDIYYAEKKLVTALDTMEKAATTDELKEAFNDHQHQTQKHVKRLEKVFKLLGQEAAGKKCEAIEGLVKEAETIISETKEGSMTRDAALIIAAQKVEHYEIATYGGLVQLAITIGHHEVSDILDETLMEEEDTDKALTDIAEGHINMEAEEEALYSTNRQKNQKEEATA